MNKHLLVLLAVIAVAAGIFQVRSAYSASCKNGSCTRVRAVPVAKQSRNNASQCKNGSCSRVKTARTVRR